MPRGQKKGWKLTQKIPKTPPKTRVKVSTGVWMTPHGTFDTFTYHLGKSVFLGAFSTAEEAVSAREKYAVELQGGAPLVTRSDARIPFHTFAESVYFAEVMKGRRDSTIRSARSRYNQHLRPELGDWPLRDITYERLSRLRKVLLDRKVSGQTKREVLLLLQAILQEGVKRGLLPTNPAALLKRPAKNSSPVEVPSWPVAVKVVEAIAAPVPRMAATVLLQTGMRLNECLSLQWDDIDLAKKTIRVARSIDQISGTINDPKTSHGNRSIAITLALVKALRVYRASQEAGTIPRSDPWVFPTTRQSAACAEKRPPILNDRNFQQRHWQPALKTVAGADFTPHALRHLWASRVLASGAPVAFAAEQLGHSSPAFTYRQYVHFLPESAGAANAFVERAMGSGRRPRNPKVIPRLKEKNFLKT